MLTGRDPLMGDFSAPDCAAYPFLKFAAGRDPGDPDRFHLILEEHQTPDGHPALARWIDDMAARPSC